MLDTTESPPISVDATPPSSAWPIKTFLERDEWIKLMLATDCALLGHGEKLLATRIALHHNVTTGQCNPSMSELGKGTGTCERTVRRTIRKLVQAGWIGVHQSRGWHHNSFELRVPETLPTVVRVQDDQTRTHVVRVKEEQTRTVRASNPDSSCKEPGHLLSDRKERTEKRTESQTLKKSERKEDKDDIETQFETFYKQYPKRVEKLKALKAYRNVIAKHLATTEELLAGAKRYAAEQSSADPKYTKYPASWLNAGCWADEPKPRHSAFDIAKHFL
jgi:hypothetical protein